MRHSYMISSRHLILNQVGMLLTSSHGLTEGETLHLCQPLQTPTAEVPVLPDTMQNVKMLTLLGLLDCRPQGLRPAPGNTRES